MRIRHTATLAATALLLALTGCTGSDKPADTKPAPSVPPYEIIESEDSGNQRTTIVEVGSTEGLEAIFNDVAAKLTEEAGHIVLINCNVGGTDTWEPRLANGKKAVGRMGMATTGLEDGETKFEPVKDAKCPA